MFLPHYCVFVYLGKKFSVIQGGGEPKTTFVLVVGLGGVVGKRRRNSQCVVCNGKLSCKLQ